MYFERNNNEDYAKIFKSLFELSFLIFEHPIVQVYALSIEDMQS